MEGSGTKAADPSTEKKKGNKVVARNAGSIFDVSSIKAGASSANKNAENSFAAELSKVRIGKIQPLQSQLKLQVGKIIHNNKTGG